MMIEAERQCSLRVESRGTYVTESVSLGYFCLALCTSDRPPVLWGYHLERGGMPLHDAFGVRCEKGATTENQCAGFKHMG